MSQRCAAPRIASSVWEAYRTLGAAVCGKSDFEGFYIPVSEYEVHVNGIHP